jgi:hypothetical protein
MAKCCKKKNKKDCQSVQERAYFKWLDAGCPESDGVEFWVAAEREILQEKESKQHENCEN